MKLKVKAWISKLSLEMVEHCNCGYSLVLPCETSWTSLMTTRFQQQKSAGVSFAGAHLCCARCDVRCCKNCSGYHTKFAAVSRISFTIIF